MFELKMSRKSVRYIRPYYCLCVRLYCWHKCEWWRGWRHQNCKYYSTFFFEAKMFTQMQSLYTFCH